MGCTSFNSSYEINNYQQETIELDMSSNIKELFHARSLINLITRIRNKIIHSYHILIYNSGACIFIKPTIAHCLRCIFYKVSSEFEGDIKKADITHKEDPPYEKKGSGMPITGVMPSTIPTLINRWKRKMPATEYPYTLPKTNG